MDEYEIQAEDDKLIIEDVARAVEENEFVPFVQPAFDLADGHVVGTETLVRWTLPEDGTVVPAAAFVPSLERTHTICGLDWCMAEAMCDFLGTTKSGAGQLPAALNISTQHAEDKDFAKRLAATADWHKVDHGQLRIELGEEFIRKDKRVTDSLIPSLVAEGFGLIADNFDADADVLRAFAGMGIKTVKVAAALWRDGDSEQLGGVVAAAEELGVKLVAETVETDAERAAVAKAGIPMAQGYGLAKPMSLEDYVALVEG